MWKVGMCPFLLLALFNMPYWFFMVVRCVVVYCCIIEFCDSVKERKVFEPIIYGIAVIIFNPLVLFHFQKYGWQIIDVALLTFLLIEVARQYKKEIV